MANSALRITIHCLGEWRKAICKMLLGNFYRQTVKCHKSNKIVMQMTNSPCLIFDLAHLKHSALKQDCCWMHVSILGIKGWTWLTQYLKSLHQSVTFPSREFWERLQTIQTAQVVRIPRLPIFPVRYLAKSWRTQWILFTLF